MSQRVNATARLSAGERVRVAIRKLVGPRAMRAQHRRHLVPDKYTVNFLDAHAAQWSEDLRGWANKLESVALKPSDVHMANLDHNYDPLSLLAEIGSFSVGMISAVIAYEFSGDPVTAGALGLAGAGLTFLGAVFLETTAHYREVALRHFPESLMGLIHSERASFSDISHFYARSVIEEYPQVKSLVVDYLSKNMIHQQNGNILYNERACDFFFVVADLLTEDEIRLILEALPEGIQIQLPKHPLNSFFSSNLYQRPELTRLYVSNIHMIQNKFPEFYEDRINVKRNRVYEPISLMLASLQMEGDSNTIHFDRHVQSVVSVAKNLVYDLKGRSILSNKGNQYVTNVLQSLVEMGVNPTLITFLKVEIARLIWSSIDWTDSIEAEKFEMILQGSLILNLEEVDPLYRGILYTRMARTYEAMIHKYLELTKEHRSLARDENLFKRIVTLPMTTLWNIGLNQDDSQINVRQRILRTGCRQLLDSRDPQAFVVAEKLIRSLHQISQTTHSATINDFIEQTLESYSESGLRDAGPAAFELYMLGHVADALGDKTRAKLVATLESRDDVAFAFQYGLGLFPVTASIIDSFKDSQYAAYLIWQAELMDEVNDRSADFMVISTRPSGDESQIKTVKEVIVMNLVESGQVKPQRMAQYLVDHGMADSFYENHAFQTAAYLDENLKALLVALAPERHLKDMLDLYPYTYSPGADHYYNDPRLVRAMMDRLYEDGKVNQAVLQWAMSFDVKTKSMVWFNAIDHLIDQVDELYAPIDQPNGSLQTISEEHNDLARALTVLLQRVLADIHQINWDKSLVRFETYLLDRILSLGIFDYVLENQISNYWQKRYNQGTESAAILREQKLHDLPLYGDPHHPLYAFREQVRFLVADRYTRSFGVEPRFEAGEE